MIRNLGYIVSYFILNFITNLIPCLIALTHLALFGNPMLLTNALLLFIIGLAMGSFATMASYRIPRKEAWVKERSRCPHCKHTLSAKDLFPFFSWAIQRGKCRYCQIAISRRYPAIELATATSFVLIYYAHGLTPFSFPLYILSVSLIILTAIDLEHMIIPDGLQIFHL